MKTWGCFVAAGIAILLGGNAQAASYQYEFTGTVTVVTSGLAAQFSVGEDFKYTFTHDTTTPDNFNLNVLGGIYEDGVTSFTANIGNDIFGIGTDSFMSVYNGNNGKDEFEFDIHNPSHSPTFGSLSTQKFVVVLTDPSATAFLTDAIPISLLLASFSIREWALAVDEGQVFGTINGVTVSEVVPIPAALPLFIAGLGAMGFAGWRKRRSV